MVLISSLSLLLQAPAAAGYGDVVDGYPSWAERELHLYTNAARVDPAAFESDYNRGGCSTADFSEDELTPKDPLYYSPPLNDAARYHSQDMRDSGNFSHDSSDGTSFGSRLADFYPESGFVGENIAYGYRDNWAVMFEGWMCSTSGHRENIMYGSWEELGTGVVDNYYTQDFGGGSPDSSGGIRMGVHTPQSPSPGSWVSLYADWAGAGLVAIAAVVDGVPYPMTLEWGEEDRGVYRADVRMPEGCVDYYFSYESAVTERAFPDDGAYLMGAGCGGEWVERDETLYPGDEADTGGGGAGQPYYPDDDGTEDVEIKGCSSAPTGSGLGLLIPALLLGLLRRRSRGLLV